MNKIYGSFWIDPEVKKEFEDLAWKKRTNFSALVREAIAAYLAQQKKEEQDEAA